MTKEELKQEVLHVFERQNRKTNDVIPKRYWYQTFLQSLNPKEQDMFEEAVSELIDEGKILNEPNGLECLRLTERGFNDLYQNSKSIAEIEEDIMDKFRSLNCRKGQGFMLRNLDSYISSLNPAEKSLVEKAIENLIDKQYIRLSEEQDFLFLEQAGFDYIY